MLVVRRVPVDDVDDVSGRLWLTERVTMVVEADAGDGFVDLRVGLVNGASAEEVRAAVPSAWRVDAVDDDAERAAVADALRASSTEVRVGARLVVVPPWEEPSVGPDDLVVTIDPGVAFGSGSHVTTRMALAALERTVPPGGHVLDFGSGTGVLAVVAARLGAAHVTAVDIDPDAVVATADNAARNGVADVVMVRPGLDAVPVAARFDVVVANVSAGVLVERAEGLVAGAADDGTLLLTGILDERAAEVVDRYGALGWRSVATTAADGWTLLELRRG